MAVPERLAQFAFTYAYWRFDFSGCFFYAGEANLQNCDINSNCSIQYHKNDNCQKEEASNSPRIGRMI